MSASQWSVALVVLAVSVAVHLLVLHRSRLLKAQLWLWLGTMATGAALVIPVTLFEGALERWAEIDPMAHTGGQATLLIYSFVFVAPLEQAVIVAAVAPFWRWRRLRMRAGLSRKLETIEGVAFTASAALGFMIARDIAYLWRYGSDWLSVVRMGLALPTFVWLSCLWGYVLGRHAYRGIGGRRFTLAWVVATIFGAVCDQLVFRRGMGALLAVLPLLLVMLLVGFWVWRDTMRDPARSSSGGRRSIFTSAPTPSLGALRDAFRQQNRSVTLKWLSFGALVTTGMITAGAVSAVFIGHRIGLDFSVVDRPDAGAEAMAPLAVLAAGILAAFPASGYLLARASGTRSVLQPAMAAALAMVLMMVFMGMLAPVAVVFAIAFAPIAFALSCVGAWLGLGH